MREGDRLSEGVPLVGGANEVDCCPNRCCLDRKRYSWVEGDGPKCGRQKEMTTMLHLSLGSFLDMAARYVKRKWAGERRLRTASLRISASSSRASPGNSTMSVITTPSVPVAVAKLNCQRTSGMLVAVMRERLW